MMTRKKIILLVILTCLAGLSQSQNTSSQNDFIENLLENIAEQNEENEIDYSDFLDDLNKLLVEPIDLNRAKEDDLDQLMILTKNQIANFMAYRKSTGRIYSLYELQLIPGFSSDMIRSISPFVSLKQESEKINAKKRAKHILLLKSEKTLQEEKGYTNENEDSRYLGNSWKYYSRYLYTSANSNLNFGFTSEKDKGEPFFKGENSEGFDFYSAHLQYNSKGILQQVNLGDYQVKFGQGLSLWSEYSSGKSALTNSHAYKSQGIKSYKSTDENQFYRGIALILEPFSNVKLALFSSYKKKDGSLSSDSLSLGISSLTNTGYHRNNNEFAQKDNLQETLFGSYLLANWKKIEFGVSFLQSTYSPDIVGTDAAYSYYNFKGDKNQNISVCYETQVHSIHLYGEAAQSKSGGRAFLQGVNIQVHPQINFEMIYRNYQKDYQSLFANAFGEQSQTQNEKGFYFGLEFHPYAKWTIKAYYDQFEFPWLRYSASSPSEGHEYFSQLEYTPNQSVSVYLRYKQENKQENTSSEAIKTLAMRKKNQYRLHFSAQINDNWEIRNRFEISHYEKEEEHETGYLIYQDLFYHFAKLPLSLNLRYALFDTESFNSAIYAYENDILNSYSVPAYYLKGNRFYFNANWELTQNLKFYIKYARSKYSNRSSIGSGNSEINGDTKSELKFLLRLRI
jgi:hypothetical protein